MIINENGWGDKKQAPAQKEADAKEVKDALKAKKLKKQDEEDAEQE